MMSNEFTIKQDLKKKNTQTLHIQMSSYFKTINDKNVIYVIWLFCFIFTIAFIQCNCHFFSLLPTIYISRMQKKTQIFSNFSSSSSYSCLFHYVKKKLKQKIFIFILIYLFIQQSLWFSFRHEQKCLYFCRIVKS